MINRTASWEYSFTWIKPSHIISKRIEKQPNSFLQHTSFHSPFLLFKIDITRFIPTSSQCPSLFKQESEIQGLIPQVKLEQLPRGEGSIQFNQFISNAFFLFNYEKYNSRQKNNYYKNNKHDH